MSSKSIVSLSILCFSLMMGKIFGSFMVDPEPPVYWLPGGQDRPSIAGGTFSFFAVWEDEREEYRHIYGTRISTDGEVLDTCGILISRKTYSQRYPAIAYGYTSADGDNYFVVWCDSASLKGARLKGNEVIDTLGITIMNEDVYSPRVAYDGSSKYMVVWATLDGDIKGKTVSIDGNVSTLFTICAEAGTQGSPDISFNGTNFFVVWVDNRGGYGEIYGARVTPDRTVLDVGGIKLVNATGSRSNPRVGYCNGYWLCVWEDTREGDKDIYGTRVDGDGNVLDDPSILISEISLYDEYYPAVASDGNKFIVTYIENYGYKDVVNALVQTDGTILSHHHSTNSLIISRIYTDVAFCNNVYFALWKHTESYRMGIVGSRIDEDGVFLDDWYCKNVGITASVQRRPDCVFGGDSVLVIWKDNILGIEGELLDSTGNPLKKITIYFPGEKPAVAYEDPYYFCVWQDASDSTIKGKRIVRDGMAMAETLLIEDSISYATALDVDGGAGTFCISWIKPGYPTGVHVCNIDTGGLIWQPPIDISNTPSTVFMLGSASVCFNDYNNGYLIAWSETDFFIDSIFCSSVGGYGGILYLRVPIGEGSYPSLTYDGSNYFCVYQSGGGLIGKWLSVGGEQRDSCYIPLYLYMPRVEFCGDGYLIIGQREGEVLGVKLSMDGSIIDSFKVSEGKDPSLAAHEYNYLIAYSSFTPYPYSSYRVWAELGSFTGVEEKEHELLLNTLKFRVIPNPFSTSVSIKCINTKDTQWGNIYEKQKVVLEIYDLTGRLVRTLNTDFYCLAHGVLWDGKEQNGKKVQAGVYFLKISYKKAGGIKTCNLLKIVKVR